METEEMAENFGEKEFEPEKHSKTSSMAESDLSTIPLVEYENLKNKYELCLEENKKLKSTLDKMDKERKLLTSEIQELSGAVFEEAHKNIDKANEGKAVAEERLYIADTNVEILREQVKQLKLLLSQSDYTLNKPRVSTKLINNLKPKAHLIPNHIEKKTYNLDENLIFLSEFKYTKFHPNKILFDKFNNWLNSGKQFDYHQISEMFLNDIRICLEFQNKEKTDHIIDYLLRNNQSPLIEMATIPFEGDCYFTEIKGKQTYKIKLEPERDFYYISIGVRNRIVSVSDLLVFLKHVSSGLIKHSSLSLYEKMSKRLINLYLSRIGFPLVKN